MKPPRQNAVDVARALAVLGLGWCNAPAMAGLPGGPLAVPQLSSTGERWLWVAGQVLLQGRLVALLSLLFGAAMVWIAGSANDQARRALLDRRLGWLAAMGVLHGALLWWGDILLPYALVALMLRPCLRWPARRLMALAIPAYAMGVVLLRVDAGVALWHHHPLPPAPAMPVLTLGEGTLFMLANAKVWLAGLPETLAAVLMTSGPLMMAGMALTRAGWLTTDHLQRRAVLLLALGLLALLVSTPLALIRASLWSPQGAWSWQVTGFWALFLQLASAPLGALGWLGVAGMLTRNAVQGWLGAAGRVSLSAYLGQSLMLRLGLPWLSGPFTVLRLATATGFVLCLQLVLAGVWHRLGWQGPAEGLWRRLYQPTDRSGDLPSPQKRAAP